MRLYTDGVFHTQWNPNAPLSGSLWDLFTLPAFLQSDTPKSAAILGVGGGAVIKQLEHFFALQEIIGVDLDRVHLNIAQRFFQVNTAKTQLIHSSAERWLEEHQHKKETFDYLLEDLFIAEASTSATKPEPRRALAADKNWMSALGGMLTSTGMLVMNMESTAQARGAVKALPLSGRAAFGSVFVFQKSMYDNAILVLYKKVLPPGAGKKSILKKLSGLQYSPSSIRKIMDFKIRRLF